MDNSDNTRPFPTPTGDVQSTPEAGPLTPPTMRDHFATPTPGAGEQTAAAQAGTTATPEAIVTAASSAGATEQLTATSAGSSSSPGTGPGTTGSSATPGGQPELDPEAIARDLGGRLKPVVEAAEDVATKALDLSAKGLTKLVDILEERRRQRQPADDTESNDPAQPTNPS